MENRAFQVLPPGFFDLPAGGSNKKIYAGCPLLIREQFGHAGSYRIDDCGALRNQNLWSEHLYINEIRDICSAIRALSDFLKKLFTYICRIIIEWMNREGNPVFLAERIRLEQEAVRGG